MKKVTLYHNPRCSKSRETLVLLQKKGIEPEVIDYINNPPTAAELKKILKLLGLKPKDLIRSKEPEYKKLKNKRSDEELIKAMIEYPKLIERPIVLANGKAKLGRPPKQVLEIL